MSWDEFRSLLAGIAPETALGRVVAIRSDTDENVIEHFTRDQKRIYDEWRDQKAKTMSDQKYEKAMANMEMMFAAMCGGGKH